jgi:hypothetical protein
MTRRVSLLLVLLAAACGGHNSGCDSANLSATCQIVSVGQCVEYSGLATVDASDVQSFCTTHSGDWSTAVTSCTTAGRLGSCKIPAEGPNTEISCSPNAIVDIRYFSPYTAQSAQDACDGVSGAVWTPN